MGETSELGADNLFGPHSKTHEFLGQDFEFIA